MEEVSSRFSRELGSEEIVILERECEDPSARDVREETAIEDRHDDIDLFTPLAQRTKQTHQSVRTTDQLTTEKTKDSPARCRPTGE